MHLAKGGQVVIDNADGALEFYDIAGNREFDLTAATREALGFGDVGTVLTSK